MFPKKTNLPGDIYSDHHKIPEDFFIPISEFSQSEIIKSYMAPEERNRVMKATYEALIEEKKKERRKK